MRANTLHNARNTSQSWMWAIAIVLCLSVSIVNTHWHDDVDTIDDCTLCVQHHQVWASQQPTNLVSLLSSVLHFEIAFQPAQLQVAVATQSIRAPPIHI